MGDFSVLITSPRPRHDAQERVTFTTPDLVTSLVVADLNLDGGTAEVIQDGRSIARLRKVGDSGLPVWLVNPPNQLLENPQSD